MNVARVLTHLRTTKRNRTVMTRIVVSLLSDSRESSVDISELRKLNFENFAVMNSFIAWAANNPDAKICDEEAARLHATINYS
jgi:hypothetical protein